MTVLGLGDCLKSQDPLGSGRDCESAACGCIP